MSGFLKNGSFEDFLNAEPEHRFVPEVHFYFPNFTAEFKNTISAF